MEKNLGIYIFFRSCEVSDIYIYIVVLFGVNLVRMFVPKKTPFFGSKMKLFKLGFHDNLL